MDEIHEKLLRMRAGSTWLCGEREVYREPFPPDGLPGLYRIDGGAELAEMQALQVLTVDSGGC